MMMMHLSVDLVFVLVVAGVGCGRAQPPPVPCCAPDKFMLHYDEVVTTQAGDMPMKITTETLDAAYDFLQAMVGMEISVNPVNGTETKLKLIQNFTAGFQWVIEGSQCTKQAIGSTVAPFRCIPAGATFEGTFTVGLEKMKVHTWLIDASTSSPISGHQRYTVTDYMCTPFRSTFIGTATSTQPPTLFVLSGGYTNFSIGIEDPDRWFKLPPACNTTVTVHPLKQLFKIPRSPHIRFF